MIIPNKSTIAEEEIEVPYGRELRESTGTERERSRERTDTEGETDDMRGGAPGFGLSALSARLQTDKNSVSNRTVIQLCDTERQSSQMFGVVIDTTGDLAGVQRTALGWSNGKCAEDERLKLQGEAMSVRVSEILSSGLTNLNASFSSNATWWNLRRTSQVV